MSSQPATTVTTQRRPGAKLVIAAAARMRRLPSSRHLARRHVLITLTKLLLPALALALLASIALWPEFDRAKDQALLALRRVGGEIEGAQLVDARYHGTDERGRPYTLTAATAKKAGPERVNLTTPKGDITLQDGTWLMLQAKQGVFIQHANQLDLSHEVTLYRDDGTTLVTESASVDMKNGAAAGAESVHAEGPFGTLDAQGFTLVDKGATIEFAGPAHLVLNGTSPAPSPAAAPAVTPLAPPAAASVPAPSAAPSTSPAAVTSRAPATSSTAAASPTAATSQAAATSPVAATSPAAPGSPVPTTSPAAATSPAPAPSSVGGRRHAPVRGARKLSPAVASH